MHPHIPKMQLSRTVVTPLVDKRLNESDWTKGGHLIHPQWDWVWTAGRESLHSTELSNSVLIEAHREKCKISEKKGINLSA